MHYTQLVHYRVVLLVLGGIICWVGSEASHRLVSVATPHAKPVLKAFGPGAGKWNSKKTTPAFRFWKKQFLKILAQADAERKFGAHAVAHLKHYFANTGQSLEVPVAELLDESTSAFNDSLDWKHSIQDWVDTLPLGRFYFVSESANTVKIRESENPDWFKAIADYHAWVHGVALKSDSRTEVQWNYCVWDPYDWDPGPALFLTPIEAPFLTIKISQTFMGEFHRQGIGREFLAEGCLQETLVW